MLQKFNAADWQHYVPKSENNEDIRSCLIPLQHPSEGPDTSVHVELRSSTPMTLNAITQDGETLFLASGQVISFQGKLTGFTSVEIVTNSPFSHRMTETRNWLEKADPTRHVVEIDESAKKPIEDLIRHEMKKMLHKMKNENIFATDESVEELANDFVNGDLEFDEPGDPDPFGLGYEEMEPDGPPSSEPAPAPTPAKPPEPAPNGVPDPVAGGQPNPSPSGEPSSST